MLFNNHLSLPLPSPSPPPSPSPHTPLRLPLPSSSLSLWHLVLFSQSGLKLCVTQADLEFLWPFFLCFLRVEISGLRQGLALQQYSLSPCELISDLHEALSCRRCCLLMLPQWWTFATRSASHSCLWFFCRHHGSLYVCTTFYRHVAHWLRRFSCHCLVTLDYVALEIDNYWLLSWWISDLLSFL